MGFQRFEANDILNFEDGLNGGLDLLEDNGITGTGNEPNLTIILRQNGKLQGDIKLVDAVVYIGATPQEIANDLNQLQ